MNLMNRVAKLKMPGKMRSALLFWVVTSGLLLADEKGEWRRPELGDTIAKAKADYGKSQTWTEASLGRQVCTFYHGGTVIDVTFVDNVASEISSQRLGPRAAPVLTDEDIQEAQQALSKTTWKDLGELDQGHLWKSGDGIYIYRIAGGRNLIHFNQKGLDAYKKDLATSQAEKAKSEAASKDGK